MKLTDWVVDYSYRFKAVKAWRHKPPAHYQEEIKAGRVPVILLAGFSMNWHFMRQLGDKISLAGHPVYAIPGLKRNYLNIIESAKFVKELIDHHNLHKVVIVAHSKGGLIGKYVLMHHNKDRRVHSLVAIATPFSGSTLAKAIPHKTFREMAPDSRIIQEIQGFTSVNKHITSIIPEYDNHVWAEQGSYLDGAKNIRVAVRGHHKVVFSKEVEKVILDSLAEQSGIK